MIAGGGQFPLLFCRRAKEEGFKVVVAALEGEADLTLNRSADEVHWIKLGQIGRIVDAFHRAGVSEAVMLGAVSKLRFFSSDFRPDRKCLSLLTKIKRMPRLHDDAFLRFVAQVLEDEGIAIRASTLFLPALLVPPGVLSRRKPTKRILADARYGFELAKDLGRFDIGQCLVVRSRTVLAVEASEGTDETIRRGGRLGRGRAVVVKVAKPNQDLRFDLPAVGAQTMATMLEAGCCALVLEAGRTLCFDRLEMLALADENDICVLAVGDSIP